MLIFRRWFCQLQSLVKMHPLDCEHCKALNECWGNDIRRRLEELRRVERPTEEQPDRTKIA